MTFILDATAAVSSFHFFRGFCDLDMRACSSSAYQPETHVSLGGNQPISGLEDEEPLMRWFAYLEDYLKDQVGNSQLNPVWIQSVG